MADGRALLLDFDGTLVDSLEAMWNAYCAFLRRLGVTPTRDEFRDLNGPPLAELVAMLRERHSLELEQSVALHLYQQEIEAALPNLSPTHGAAMLLETARTADWKVAVVTSNDRHRVERWLTQTGLADWIETVVGGDVRPGKPDPTPYRTALQRLGCAPQSSIAIEDSAPGYRAAAASGVQALFYRPFNRMSGPKEASSLPSLPALCPVLRGDTPILSVRLATTADRPFLFGLRNDPSAVNEFRTARPLDSDELERRFRLDPTLTEKITLVAERQGAPAAMIRFDRQGNTYLASIIMERDHRGQGLGSIALQDALDALFAMHGPIVVTAEVAESNAASRRLFERCGFQRDRRNGRFLTYVMPAAAAATAPFECA